MTILRDGETTDAMIDWLRETALICDPNDAANLRICADRMHALYYGAETDASESFASLLSERSILQHQLAQTTEALTRATRERDERTEILRAGRWALFGDLNPQGKTILDFYNVWLDQAERANAELRREIADLHNAPITAPADGGGRRVEEHNEQVVEGRP